MRYSMVISTLSSSRTCSFGAAKTTDGPRSLAEVRRWEPIPCTPWPLTRRARCYRRSALMIRFENVTKIYKGGVTALRDLSADVQKGEFVFLVGPSGSGKSTCLRLLLREEVPSEGSIVVAGRDISRLSHWKVPALRRNIGTIFQD